MKWMCRMLPTTFSVCIAGKIKAMNIVLYSLTLLFGKNLMSVSVWISTPNTRDETVRGARCIPHKSES